MLPLGSLEALAESAGLQWVNSDAEKIRAVHEAMASEPPAIHAPRERKPMPAVDEGPLVLVETRKDLSQFKLPFENAAAGDAGPGSDDRSTRRRRRRLRAAFFCQGRRSSERWYAAWCIRSSQVNGAVCGSRSRRRASLSGSACQWPLRLRLEQAFEQRIDRRAAVERLVAQQHHVAAGAERERGGFGIGDVCAVDPARPGHAQVVAEDRAVEAELQAQDVLQPARRKAGRAASTFG